MDESRYIRIAWCHLTEWTCYMISLRFVKLWSVIWFAWGYKLVFCEEMEAEDMVYVSVIQFTGGDGGCVEIGCGQEALRTAQSYITDCVIFFYGSMQHGFFSSICVGNNL